MADPVPAGDPAPASTPSSSTTLATDASPGGHRDARPPNGASTRSRRHAVFPRLLGIIVVGVIGIAVDSYHVSDLGDVVLEWDLAAAP
ncbi:MAG: hypothetical protein WKF93_06165 [Acidimicrobiales bacterium]